MDFSVFYQILNTIIFFVPGKNEIQKQQPQEKAREMALQQHAAALQMQAPMRAAKKMNKTQQPFIDPIFPQPWELRWRKVNLSERDEKGFILTPCYYELTDIPLEELYNKKFRIHMKPELEEENKICQLRFPTGVRLRYRIWFKNKNSYVFFAYGHTEKRMVAFSRKISDVEVPGGPNQIWRGILHIPCQFSLLIFRPFEAGEVFEFRILRGYEYIDKCSKLDEIYKDYV